VTSRVIDTISDGVPLRLVARTTRIPDPGSLLEILPRSGVLTWLRGSDGIVGWGEVARVETSGSTRFCDAQAWWTAVSENAVVRDDIGVPGTGLIALGSFAYADDPGASALVVPAVLVGRRGGVSWITTVSANGVPPGLTRFPREPVKPTPAAAFSDGAMSGTEWTRVVAQAVRRIREGELEKVVLAHDLVAELSGPLDVRGPLAQLAARYPTCWTYHLDGLLGATPELLVRRERGLVTSRVLAGTIRRTGDDEHDLALAGALARSSKDLEEHEYAVRSVANALAPHCASMNVPEAPFVLHLANVMHLATDVAGVLGSRASALELAAALHPSAAVGGTPTDRAVALIAEIEGMDRGRYAGPVGWIDADGDGEFGIALRSGQYEQRPDGQQLRLFAGCGIVADSDPEAELVEAHAKFVPIRDTLPT
jgi:menaquinone-specific isochorismate synthase